ncbi:MAG: hypothetical protein AB7N76_10925 [Planctomycetota bacterium]
MSDLGLRELERRFRASGTIEDETAWLRARVQAGELAQERAELAAYCGQPAARFVELKSEPQEHGSRRWYLFLSWRGQEPCVRASLAALELVREPARSNRQLVAAHARSLRWLLEPDARVSVQEAARNAVDMEGDKLGWVLAANADQVLTRPRRWGDPAATVASATQADCPDLPVHERVRDELISWALGYGDPVRGRVGLG